LQKLLNNCSVSQQDVLPGTRKFAVTVYEAECLHCKVTRTQLLNATQHPSIALQCAVHYGTLAAACHLVLVTLQRIVIGGDYLLTHLSVQ